MAAANPTLEPRKKYYSVEEANRALPLVRAIVTDIVRHCQQVEELQARLSHVTRERRRQADDLYSEELAQTQAELAAQEEHLREYIDELKKLGVELKSEDGLCDFPSLMDGREVYLCWRLGEPQVSHWHELEAGFAGRKRITGANRTGSGADVGH
jgi:hypothetical protein